MKMRSESDKKFIQNSIIYNIGYQNIYKYGKSDIVFGVVFIGLYFVIIQWFVRQVYKFRFLQYRSYFCGKYYELF